MDASEQAALAQDQRQLRTRILPVRPTGLGKFSAQRSDLPLEDWNIELSTSTDDAANLQIAVNALKTSDIPVAFPTETVYGLGADATRSTAVKGIYHAKQRPSDNPLIVHIASLSQLRRLLVPSSNLATSNTDQTHAGDDPIPAIYHPLIRRFWPGPLTIILSNPQGSSLAPEVTAGLSTFGARMPRNLLALALIKLADVPVAAPSANASTKPSPTAAEHVMHDLEGRIELILDGGLCDIGVESTVVDGLSSPPAILRPGGIGLDQIRKCQGWEDTTIGYRDISEKNSKPRAPGMKYRHYSPKAPVILVEAGGKAPYPDELARHLGEKRSIGLVRTKTWTSPRSNRTTIGEDTTSASSPKKRDPQSANGSATSPIDEMLREFATHESIKPERIGVESDIVGQPGKFDVWDMRLGPDTAGVARGLFSALRDLDQRDVDAIIVEGIDDSEGDIAAAVMNRLRKAAEVKLDHL